MFLKSAFIFFAWIPFFADGAPYKFTGVSREVPAHLYRADTSTIEMFTITVQQIQSTETGELGGWIESEKKPFTIWHTRPGVSENAFVFGNARVSENAHIHGEAWVFDNAQIYGNAPGLWAHTGLWERSDL